ncbi:hypothetical protein E2I00_017339, partial [Balaenoptera physalus]
VTLDEIRHQRFQSQGFLVDYCPHYLSPPVRLTIAAALLVANEARRRGRDGEERRAKAVALSYSIRDSGTGKMTTFTFLQSSEDPRTHGIEKSFDGAGCSGADAVCVGGLFVLMLITDFLIYKVNSGNLRRHTSPPDCWRVSISPTRGSGRATRGHSQLCTPALRKLGGLREENPNHAKREMKEEKDGILHPDFSLQFQKLPSDYGRPEGFEFQMMCIPGGPNVQIHSGMTIQVLVLNVQGHNPAFNPIDHEVMNRGLSKPTSILSSPILNLKYVVYNGKQIKKQIAVETNSGGPEVDAFYGALLQFSMKTVPSDRLPMVIERLTYYQMGNEFKRIVLLKGFQHISDYQFSVIKCLLAKDLRLSSKMQEEYDRVKIANLMEAKFRGPACVDKLIELVKDIEEIKDLAKTLKNEKLKVIRRSRAKEATAVKKSKLNKPSPDQSTSTTNKALGPESIKDTPVKEKKTTKTNESKRMNLKKEQSQLPGLLVTSTQSTESLPQTPQMLPPKPSSSSSTKILRPQCILSPVAFGKVCIYEIIPDLKNKKNDIATKINDLKRKTVSQKQSQLPGTSATSTCPTGSSCPVKSIPPPTPSSSFSVKEEENTYFWIQKIEDTTNKTLTSKKRELCLEQSQLPQCANPSIIPNEACLQTPQMLPPTSSSSSSTKKPRWKAVPKEASREEGFQRGPKEVMVLKATEPFTYDVREGERKMFHATVATESQFFQVKVYHVDLKEKFIPKKIIAISDYFGRNGFLEVFNASSVSDVNPDRKMEIPRSLIQKANATPKISHLYSQALGTFVNGVFLVHKKLVSNECIYYEIRDDTGVMEVLVYGQRLTRINCEKGDKLKLICFELALSGDKRQLRSIIHSFIKVTKARKSKEEPFNPESYMETSLELFF